MMTKLHLYLVCSDNTYTVNHQFTHCFQHLNLKFWLYVSWSVSQSWSWNAKSVQWTPVFATEKKHLGLSCRMKKVEKNDLRTESERQTRDDTGLSSPSIYSSIDTTLTSVQGRRRMEQIPASIWQDAGLWQGNKARKDKLFHTPKKFSFQFTSPARL